MSKSQKSSTLLSEELETAIGCDPSTVFCKNEKPDVPACNSQYQFNLGFKTISSCFSCETLMMLSVMSIFPLPVKVCDDIPVSYTAKNTCDKSVLIQRNPLPLKTDCKSYSFGGVV